jgi:tRNA threonylcarbamoyladenosine biosynthesis protein TsaE
MDTFTRLEKNNSISLAKPLTLTSHGIRDTHKLALILAKKLKKGDVILLSGELGSGKTYFTKGIARAFGVKNANTIVNSPTFVLLSIYKGKKIDIYHYDLYRISDPRDIFSLSWEEALEGVAIVEWGEKIKALIKREFWEVFFEHRGINRRRITIRHCNRKDKDYKIAD